MSWKVAIIGLGLAAGGFLIAAKMSKKGGASATVGGIHYRAEVYLGDGGWYAQVFADDKPAGTTLGPVPDEAGAAKLAADFLAAMNVSAFYTLRTEPNTDPDVTEPDWWFDGWSRGVKITSGGPFANETAAKTAAQTWARQALKMPPFEAGASA